MAPISKVKHRIPATYVARHLPSSSRSTSTCSTTLTRSRTHAHGKTVARPSRSCQLFRITRESIAGRGRLFARLATRAFVSGFHILSTEGGFCTIILKSKTIVTLMNLLEMDSQDSHWGAAIHLYCLWQEIPIQGLKNCLTGASS